MSVLAPGACRACEMPLLRASRLPVCDACRNSMAPQHMLLCRVCGESLGMDSLDPERTCSACAQDPPPFVEARAYGEFEGNLRTLIHLMKFEGLPALAELLGQHLAEAMCQLKDPPTEMVVVPVPLFRGKRRFNQSECLAAVALKRVTKTRPEMRWSLRSNVLARTRKTESQYGLSVPQRRENLRGAFAVLRPEIIAGHVLLVDDIYTTGATARECTKTLLRAGAASVRVVTLARAQRLTAMSWTPRVPTVENPSPQLKSSTQTM